ncbi:choice-of-anchor L domain-containing protein [Cloacibacterium caeni]|uniref:choice-of-anchor L domain-containing protein n=1 Tax=Cloacibacterium caeni TaxID=2004710 RepID=UPI001BCE9792|nr:choice-of-anchor L domain-containing protein [Cloacibacterium caeni]
MNSSKNLSFILLLFITFINAQYINVNTSFSANDLVDKLIGTNNNCLLISNVSISGWDFGAGDTSYGFFTKGSSNFEIDEGIILSTGKAKKAEGPKNDTQSEYNFYWGKDQDLIDILNKYHLDTTNIRNATSLEFDFIANTDKISFEYMFLSEEYRPRNCYYSDAFAFLIKKADNSEAYRNIAIVPNTTSPVTSLTISGANTCPQNINYFGGYLGIDDPNNSPTNFNGQTKVLNAESSIEKGVKYHIKLVIADHGDSSGRYDSAVFLKAGSFVGSKDIGTDRLISTNNPLCEGDNLTLDATEPGSTYQWYKDGNILSGETSATYTVNSPGKYEVYISNSSCNLRGAILVEYLEKVIVAPTTFTNCDTNFDGNIPIKLDDLNTTIITNYKPEFVVKYYQNLTDATLSNTNTLPNNWSYNTDTTIYVRVENGVCAPEIQPIEFKLGTTLNLLTNEATPPSICDDDLDAIKSVNLKTFEPFFTTDNSVSITYFNSENDAKNNVNPISSTQNITSTGSYFLRFEKANFCPNWAKITVNIKAPKASTDLQNKTICKNTTAEVDAGTNFIYYKWSNGTEGETLHNATYGIGTHYVELTSTNGCVYKQSFTISEAVDPVIDSVIEQGNRITINVSGGTAPYEYYLDQRNWQNSNVFYNLNRGIQKVYVRDAYVCTPVEYEFTIINIINAITPNGDGINDVLDYSDLRVKKDVKISIFDRFGKKVYSSEKQSNYIWNGTENGRSIVTGTYWYVLEWTEPDTNTKVTYKNWIIVKNRN